MAHQPPAAQPTHQHEHDRGHGAHWHQGSPGYFDESARTWDTPDKIKRSARIADAHRASETGHAAGKIVGTI